MKLCAAKAHNISFVNKLVTAVVVVCIAILQTRALSDVWLAVATTSFVNPSIVDKIAQEEAVN